MKFSRILFFLVLSALVVFTSCRKEELSEDIITETPVIPEVATYNPLVAAMVTNSSSAGSLDLGCFSVDMPFDLSVDGTIVTINTEGDFETAIPVDAEYVDFVYPLNITYPDGETATVADGEELGEAFATCIPDTGWSENAFPAFLICELNSCYQIVYPLNLVDGSGNTYVANDENEFIELIATVYDLFFEFPVSMVDEDGNTVTAGSDEELFELLAACDVVTWPSDTTWNDTTWTGGGFNQLGCYEIAFPMNAVDQNGNTVVINDENEFVNALLNGDIIDLAYPITLIDEDGNTLSVADEAGLIEAIESCEGVFFNPIDAGVFFMNSTNLGFADCYTVLYPVNLSDFDGNTATASNDAEAMELINSGQWLVELPVTIEQDGVSITITDSMELYTIWAECE